MTPYEWAFLVCSVAAAISLYIGGWKAWFGWMATPETERWQIYFLMAAVACFIAGMILLVASL